MAWLKIDDRFPEHRKIVALRRADRWTWLELLAYCARHGSGNVPAGIVDILRYVTPAFVHHCTRVGLLDENPDGSYEVHDWNVYNAQTIEDRVAAHLDSNPSATANQVHRAIGGKREAVLRIVARIQENKPNDGSPGTTTPSTPGTGLAGSPIGTQSVPLARARGPLPVPVLQEPAPAPLRTSTQPPDETEPDPEPVVTPGAGAGAGLERIDPLTVLRDLGGGAAA